MTSRSTSWGTKPNGKDKPWLALTLALVLVSIAANSRPSRAEWMGENRSMMGTDIAVYLWSDDQLTGIQAVDAVFAEVQRIDELMSTYKPASLISRINKDAADGPVAAGGELFGLLERSLDISILTLGAFDISYDSVGQHYDFRERAKPLEAVIERELSSIGYRLVVLDKTNQTVAFAKKGVRINLGGIAKGYAVERCVEILRQHGIENAIVTAGGDSRLLGDRRGKPWIVGVKDPRDENRVAIRIPLENEAISTSGDYERFFDEDGIRYHHIIQPTTGRPVIGVHSATIVGPDAVITDALSTSVFVMGVDRGLRLIATLPDYEGMVIDASGQLFYSDGLQPPENNAATPEPPE